jgi:hypothetical protein
MDEKVPSAERLSRGEWACQHFKHKEGSLGRWVTTQRRAFYKDDLGEDRKELLDNIGFVWDLGNESKDELWRAKYEELKAYRMEHGHTNVGAEVSQVDKNALYHWIRRQRVRQEAGRLKPKREDMLEELGVEW